MTFDRLFPDNNCIRTRIRQVLQSKKLLYGDLERQTDDFNPIGRLVILRAALAHPAHCDALAKSWLCAPAEPSCDPVVELLEEIARARGFAGVKPACCGEDRAPGWCSLYTPELLDDAEAYARAVFARDARRLAGDLAGLSEYTDGLFDETELPADYVAGLIGAVGGDAAAMLRVLAVAGGRDDPLRDLSTADLAQLLTTAECPPPACFDIAQRVYAVLDEDTLGEDCPDHFERAHALVEALRGADYRCADVGVIMRHACDERPVECGDADDLAGYDDGGPVAVAIAEIAAHYGCAAKRAPEPDDERAVKRARPLE